MDVLTSPGRARETINGNDSYGICENGTLENPVNRNTSSTLLRVAAQWIPYPKQGPNEGKPVSHCGSSIKINHQSMYKGPQRYRVL